MAKSLEKLSSIVSSVNSDIISFTEGYNEFLKEQAYGVVSQEIPNLDSNSDPLALSTIYLENDMKGRMLRYSKVVLTFPDGSNPLIIPNDYANQPGSSLQNQFIVRVGSVGAEVFPETTYPVGSLILGLDYEANSINAAAGDETNVNEVQYNYGGFLASSGIPASEGGTPLYDFSYDRSNGVLNADGGFTSSGLITSKQRQAINCGFYHSTSSIVYLPFGYGGTSDATSSSGYLEFGGYVVPCNGYVEYVVVRGESPGRNTKVGFVKASAGTEVPVLSGAAGLSSNGPESNNFFVDMLYDDTAYRFDTFKNQGGQIANTFSAGDVIMFTLDTTNPLYDAIATAVLVFDWNNQL